MEKHASRFSQVYAASGKVFKELDQFQEQFKIWIAPALVDLDTLFEQQLNEPQDWDSAFQAAKKKKEEMSSLSRYTGKLSDYYCPVINYTLIKTATTSVLDASLSA